jgi:hypothetical protein
MGIIGCGTKVIIFVLLKKSFQPFPFKPQIKVHLHEQQGFCQAVSPGPPEDFPPTGEFAIEFNESLFEFPGSGAFGLEMAGIAWDAENNVPVDEIHPPGKVDPSLLNQPVIEAGSGYRCIDIHHGKGYPGFMHEGPYFPECFFGIMVKAENKIAYDIHPGIAYVPGVLPVLLNPVGFVHGFQVILVQWWF